MNRINNQIIVEEEVAETLERPDQWPNEKVLQAQQDLKLWAHKIEVFWIELFLVCAVKNRNEPQQ